MKNKIAFLILIHTLPCISFANTKLLESDKKIEIGMSLNNFMKLTSCKIIKGTIGKINHNNKPTEDSITSICNKTANIDVEQLVTYNFKNETLSDVSIFFLLSQGTEQINSIDEMLPPKEMGQMYATLNIKKDFERGADTKWVFQKGITKNYLESFYKKYSKKTFNNFHNLFSSFVSINNSGSKELDNELNLFLKNKKSNAFWLFKDNKLDIQGTVFYSNETEKFIRIDIRRIASGSK